MKEVTIITPYYRYMDNITDYDKIAFIDNDILLKYLIDLFKDDYNEEFIKEKLKNLDDITPKYSWGGNGIKIEIITVFN
jgi:hypothetical protein